MLKANSRRAGRLLAFNMENTVYIKPDTNLTTIKTPKEVPTTVQDFVSKEINVWGFDYVEGLFNEGYEPAYDNARQRWIWLQA